MRFNVTFRYADGEVSLHENMTSNGVHNIISPLNLDQADTHGLLSVTVEVAP